MTVTCYAQDNCKMCGDWVGVYESSKMHPTEGRLVPADWKLYIRIKKIDGFYTVRVKTRIADNSGDYFYWPDYTVYQADDNKIFLRYDGGYDDNNGNGYGTFAYSVDIIHISLEYQYGILYLDGKQYVRLYDNNDNLIDNKDIKLYKSPIKLYKDDNDW